MYTLHIDTKYLHLISSRLDRFKRTKQNTYNFRCPLCGDSQTHQHKARGYIFELKGSLIYKCHNCGASMGLGSLIEKMDTVLHKEYVLDIIKQKNENSGTEAEPEPEPEVVRVRKKKPLSELKKISQLDSSHPVKLYIVGRKIPNFYHSRTYYCPKFKEWTNSIVPGMFMEPIKKDEKRLILPYYDKDGKLAGYQGRSLINGPNVIRYMTIRLDNSVPKIYGMDLVDIEKDIFVVEGPIDSMHLGNSIAMMGADMTDLNYLGADKSKYIFVFDNEPRQKHNIKRIKKLIDDGYRVCIWPDNVKQKDVNLMRRKGNLTNDKIQSIILDNTFSGVAAMARLSEWKKV